MFFYTKMYILFYLKYNNTFFKKKQHLLTTDSPGILLNSDSLGFGLIGDAMNHGLVNGGFGYGEY